MAAKRLPPWLTIWASAYLGCISFLLLGLRPDGSVTIALLAQLCWLAFIGSVPTTLALGAASRAASATGTLIAISTAAVTLLSVAWGWEHTDFLLSGARWFADPQRRLARFGIVSLLGLLGALSWLWLIWGARLRRGLPLVLWLVFSGALIALVLGALSRYRAYEYSMAQLVFPAGVLCGAAIYNLVRGSRRGRLVLGAASLCLLCGLGSRLDSELVATGEREVLAQSRAGTLASLYVLPHFGKAERWTAGEARCPELRPRIDDSPIGIEAEARRNVILISVDALRKDVVGTEVGGRPVTPELSRFASTGVSFENATSTYPATLFAVGSAFTGWSPAELYLAPALPETIFTRSRAEVDRQIAVLPDVSWFRLPIVGQFLAPEMPVDFAANDAAATDQLIARLRDARSEEASVMAWVHYYSPHDPYVPQPSFPFGAGKKNAYLSEVAYFDRELGRLLRYLESDGWLQDSLVVFFSDHGEALGDRSYFGHHVYLDSWMIDVPLVIWHRSLPPSRARVGASLADIAPTVLQFLGLPSPQGVPAKSLFSLDPEQANRPTFSEAFPVRGRELFDSFRLPALDEATIRKRIRGIRTASKGYEPKGAITVDAHRLIHHRGADATMVYERQADGNDLPARGAAGRELSKLLGAELERWEADQARRIRCRLRISEDPPEESRPR